MTIKTYMKDGRVEEYPNAHLSWDYEEEESDSGYRIHSMDKNFASVQAFVYPSECDKIEVTSEESDRVFKRSSDSVGLSSKMWKIAKEIEAERKQKDEKFGEQNYQVRVSLTEIPGFDHALEYFRKQNSNPLKITWHTIIMEEVSKAFAETDFVKMREEMIHVAAIAVQIIEYLDRRADE